jgi:DNA repair exonuclease SbcCD ATPase subunit
MIKFTKLRFKNFGSFGNNFTEIDFGKKGNYLVSGKNGDGKSFAFLDAITFGLFGVPFRNINIPQLVNSINKKNCVVEVEFDIGMTKYLVRRGLSPKIFEIHKDGKLIEQAAKTKEYQEYLEKSILKMGYKSFTQVVILGKSSFVPFMQLSAADRREVIENVLDIGIFSSMNLVLKGKFPSRKSLLSKKRPIYPQFKEKSMFWIKINKIWKKRSKI